MGTRCYALRPALLLAALTACSNDDADQSREHGTGGTDLKLEQPVDRGGGKLALEFGSTYFEVTPGVVREPRPQLRRVGKPGAYAKLAPGETVKWTVTWYARQLPTGLTASPGNPDLIAFAARTLE